MCAATRSWDAGRNGGQPCNPDLAFSARPRKKGPAMTAAFVENGQSSDGCAWDYLLQTWRELDVPEGWRAEITSRGNAREDRTKKYRAYARAGVPMYLLIDRFDTRGPMVTLFTEPNEDGTYKHTDAVPFGKPMVVPSPFDVRLPTDEFPGPAV
ncbi:Uma2 family endonuclease [Streptomyces sp. ID01-9D]|uniref:Uma2 family endonuclease n=1 Tax=Streptomyces sp. ID01-9D TaxID=3028659 RepID=UPI0029C11982|nr:Uma2 family endonuclease [Streptomyces sp. ID01-9D]MDX5575950.1 Uma2 family endonuclease [Streptomyces sp. ID01-9D]